MFVEVLGREHDLRDADGLAVFVPHRDLALGVRPEHAGLAALACVRQRLEDLVGEEDRRRHQFGRLVAGIAEHDALIARALGVDALGDIDGLLVQMHVDLAGVPVKPLLLVADVLDGQPRQMGDVVLGDRLGAAHLSRDHDAVRRRQRLAGDPRLRHLTDVSVHDLVRDAVTDLVGMAFGNGFAGEEVVRARHGGVPCHRSNGAREHAVRFIGLLNP